MPTNLLMWNVQFFTVNKISMANSEWIDLVNTNNVPVDGTFDTLMNLEYITSNLQFVNAGGQGPVHLFVLIENLSSQGTLGSLAGGNGAIGARLLLDRIRGVTHNPNWMLVPPLKLVDRLQTEQGEDDLFALVREGAYTECISVFYRSDLLSFVGPYVWPAAGNNLDPTKTAQANTGQLTGAYPDEWDGTYPPGNYFAGQFEYFYNPGARTGEVLFPDVGSRRPFFTQFREIGGNQRLISLVSVHYPPNGPAASVAFSRTLGMFAHGTYPIQADEVLLVGGDINLDYLSDIPAMQHAVYDIPAQDGFQMVLDIQRNPGLVRPTIIRRAINATLQNYRSTVGLDNIALRVGAGLQPFGYFTNVYDRVDRTDPSMMFNSPASIAALGFPEQDIVFRLQQNYKYMGPVPGVSDHLPIFLSF
jgi:hypothetical protein